MNHKLPDQKVRAFEVSAKSDNWKARNLKDRSLRVGMEECLSDRGLLKSGLPQDSVLLPLLFMMYDGNIASGLEHRCIMFVDDIKLLGTERLFRGIWMKFAAGW